MMNNRVLKDLEEVRTCRSDTPDDIFICFSSFEERCLGVVRRFCNYVSKRSYILHIEDEENEERDKYCQELESRLSRIGTTRIIETQHKDPIMGMRLITKEINEACREQESVAITLDISTFPKKQLLLMLRALDQSGLFESTRLLYTEPQKYAAQLNQPLSFGLKEIAAIPTFTGIYDSLKELTLIVFLGYEGDRALALWENIEPHKTIAVIMKPAYHDEWEGKTEEINSALLASLERESILYVDSNPLSTVELLKNLIFSNKPKQTNWYIAPLGSKLQTVGLYYFLSKYPEAASIIYASPLRHNETYFSKGIGRTVLVPSRS